MRVRQTGGGLEGIETGIDMDMSYDVVAEILKADMLLLPTGVERVAVHFGKPEQKWLERITLEEAQRYMDAGEFPPGSMGPKMQALMNYVRSTGGTGVITTPEKMKDAVKGLAGTHIVR
mgnify:CR=1 FL=1